MSVDETASPAAGTRARLIEVAEALFVARGPDEVPLREILREAGQRNQSALQYHFGGRQGLIEAIVNRRMAQLDARRCDLLEAIDAGQAPPVALRSTCELLARPVFQLCREDRGFRDFLGVFGRQLLASDRELTFGIEGDGQIGLVRLRDMLLGVLPRLPLEVLVLRAENAYSFAVLAISRRARRRGSFRGRRAELFFHNLVDQIAAMLGAPVSDETQALIDPGA